MKLYTLILFMLLAIAVKAQDETVPPPAVAEQQTPDTSEKEETLTFAEEMPRFPGGESAYQQYLSMNIHYPDSAKKYGREGTVYIYFEVARDGSIENVRCIKSVPGAPELTVEAIRVLKAMPKWEPGKMNGRAVRVGVTTPVRFVLQ